MRLKSLEMQGFKSFADRTLINFDRGVTIVVGPNGSGKSNISDAVRWVLGEMSSKNIRGTKMEDVIFGGTSNRNPMSFAEVSLTFDNTDPENRIDSDYSEITVTRRYHRSGESEYMINRKSVRLKDITELFFNTGIGKNGYSIISQGNIANVLSQKSEERRAIFEEAAGISKYRYKKLEAERNLHAAEENLVRITDINAELEARIGPLENESKKAQQYLELYEAKKKYDIAVWTYDIENVKYKFDEIDLKYRLSKNDYDDSEFELNALEKESEDSFNKSQENKYKGEIANAKIAEFTQKKHEIESENRVFENDIVYIKAQIEQANSEIAEKTPQREAGLAKLDILNSELNAKKEELKNIVIKQDENNAEMEKLQYCLDEAKNAVSDKEIEITSIKNKVLEKKLLISTLEGSHKSDDKRISDISFETEECKEELEGYSVRIKKADESIKSYTDKLDSINSDKAEFECKRNELIAKSEEEKNAVNQAKIEIDTKQHRADTLKRMEELFEGYSNSVRVLMKASESNQIKGICGPVSRLISVEGKYSIAIETCLGANIQNIIVEDENAAKAAINYLKMNNAGRSTFYPITSVKASPLNVSKQELQKYSGFIAIASEAVKTENKYSSVIEYLLGRTVLFDNIDNATAVAKATGYRFRIATLDGQLINSGGSFTGGSVKRDSGMLTRTAEISALTERIKVLENEIKKRVSNAEKLNKDIAEFDSKISDCEENAALMNVLLSAEQTQRQVLKAEFNNIEKRLAALNAELIKLDSDKEGYDSEYRKISLEISDLESQIQINENAADELRGAQNAVNTSLSSSYDRNNSLILEASEKRNEIANCENAISLQNQTVENLSAQIEIAKQKLNESDEKLNRISQSVTDNKEAYDKLIATINEFEEQKKLLNSETEKYEIRINELRNRIKDCTHKRESLFQAYTKLESAREKVMGEQDMLTSKLWDEYEMSFSAAKEADDSGICEENYKDFTVRQAELRTKLKRLGPVNVNAIEEYKEVKERYTFLSAQIEDLNKSKANLLGIISKLETEMRTKFEDTFQQINIHFKRVFKELFGGGTAEIVLSDPDDVLSSGVEINVAPPGKIINNINLLSGGEKAFVAIALFFAILNVNPSPFCILDEIESALDEVNVQRFAEYSKYYSEKTQFIIITHRRGTMESADSLYGVTMQERGISTVLSIDVKTAESKWELN